MNLNKAFVLGNLTRDPELRTTPSGTPVCSFGLATNRFGTDNTGQRQQYTEFHSVVAWGKQAEIINQYLRKGSLLLVEGRLQTRNWQDQQGVKHYRTEVVAERIQLGPRPSGTQSANRDGAPPSPFPSAHSATTPAADPMPIIELPDDKEEVDIKDIPF